MVGGLFMCLYDIQWILIKVIERVLQVEVIFVVERELIWSFIVLRYFFYGMYNNF